MRHVTANPIPTPTRPPAEISITPPNDAALDAALGALATAIARRTTPLFPRVLNAVREAIARDLPDLARCIVESAGDEAGTEGHARLRPILHQLATLTPAEEPAETVVARFERQALDLIEHRPHLVAPVEVARSMLPRLRVWRTPAGNSVCMLTSTGRPIRLASPFVDGPAAAARFVESRASRPTYVLPAMPVARMLERLRSTRHRRWFQPPIDVIERDVVRLAARLAGEEYGGAWLDERLAVHAGAHAHTTVFAAVEDHPTRRPGTVLVRDATCTDGTHAVVESIRQSANTIHARCRRDDTRAVHDVHAERDPAWWCAHWQARRAAGEPLRICILASRFTPVQRHQGHGLARAFQALGHEVAVHGEPQPWSAAVDVAGAVRDGNVDLVVLLDRLRPRDSVLPARIPVFSWIQEDRFELRSIESAAAIGPLDYLAVPEVAMFRDCYGYPHDRLTASAHRTDPEYWAAMPDPDAVDGPVLYVGNGSETPEAIVKRLAPRGPLADAAGAYLTAVYASLAAGRWLSWAERTTGVIEVAMRSGMRFDEDHPAIPALVELSRMLFDRAVRHQTLEWAATWADRRGRDLCLVGDGWETHPTLRRWAAPPFGAPDDLRDALRRASVVLNVNGAASLHRRFLDAVSAGRVVLTRRNPADALNARRRAISEALTEADVHELEGVLALAQRDPRFGVALAEHDAMLGVPTAGSRDPARVARLHSLRVAGCLSPVGQTDRGLVASLREGPGDAAPSLLEIPGIEPTLFDTEAAMHAALDAVVVHPGAAAERMRPIRAAVHREHSFLPLAETVIERFFRRGSRVGSL